MEYKIENRDKVRTANKPYSDQGFETLVAGN
jgi:hypothetical protein